MGPLDATWHLLNFFGPAIGLALLAPPAAKLLWRRELHAVPLRRLVLATGGASALALLGALVAFGRDGRIAGYAAAVLAAALALWWSAFRVR
jgi:hypothetical protein